MSLRVRLRDLPDEDRAAARAKIDLVARECGAQDDAARAAAEAETDGEGSSVDPEAAA